MELKRARRRRDLARMKAKAVRIFGRLDNPSDGWDLQRHAKLADNLHYCSRPCCNQRKRDGWSTLPEQRTMQERRFYSEPID